MSKTKTSVNTKSQTADDILASLMDDLKDVDSVELENDLGLDPNLFNGNAALKPQEDDLLVLDDSADASLNSSMLDNSVLSPGVNSSDGEELSILANTNLDYSSNSSLDDNFSFSKISEQPGGAAVQLSNKQNVGQISDEDVLSDEALDVSSNEQNDDLNLNISEGSPFAALSQEVLPAQDDEVASSSNHSLDGDFESQKFNHNSDSQGVVDVNEKTSEISLESHNEQNADYGDGEKTVAVAGYSQRSNENYDDKVKVSVGQVRGGAFSSGYAAWGSAEANLVQAENLRIAQEKILSLEKENEKLRTQNEELIAASEIVKERADLLTSQLRDLKNDRDQLEDSFKNESNVIRSQISRKDAELVKASIKIEELENRMKFDLKKIRVRERELENRLELIRAEKNALVKTKDEQILDLRRKLDQVQLEVESYRHKCVELNKVIDTNQESFKRTTRALRLAMANLELQEENGSPLKKAE